MVLLPWVTVRSIVTGSECRRGSWGAGDDALEWVVATVEEDTKVGVEGMEDGPGSGMTEEEV